MFPPSPRFKLRIRHPRCPPALARLPRGRTPSQDRCSACCQSAARCAVRPSSCRATTSCGIDEGTRHGQAEESEDLSPIPALGSGTFGGGIGGIVGGSGGVGVGDDAPHLGYDSRAVTVLEEAMALGAVPQVRPSRLREHRLKTLIYLPRRLSCAAE